MNMTSKSNKNGNKNDVSASVDLTNKKNDNKDEKPK